MGCHGNPSRHSLILTHNRSPDCSQFTLQIALGLPCSFWSSKPVICTRKPLIGLVLPKQTMLAVQERLFAWLGGLRASDICGGLLAKLAEHGMANGQRMKLEALRVRLSCHLPYLSCEPHTCFPKCSHRIECQGQRIWSDAALLAIVASNDALIHLHS